MSAGHGHAHGASSRKVLVAVLTVSDSRTEETDKSGRAAQELIESAGHGVAAYAVLPDEPVAVRERVRGWIEAPSIDAVVLNGGTGISPRDRTFEALVSILDKRLDGFGELFRVLSFEEIGSAAMLSRAVGGIAGGTAVFSLPGSTAAVRLALTKLILPQLGHLVDELRKQS